MHIVEISREDCIKALKFYRTNLEGSCKSTGQTAAQRYSSGGNRNKFNPDFGTQPTRFYDKFAHLNPSTQSGLTNSSIPNVVQPDKMSEEDKSYLREIVELCLKASLPKREWSREELNFQSLIHVWSETKGLQLLQSIQSRHYRSELNRLCSHLKHTKLKTAGLPLSENHNRQAVKLIKQLITRPGQTPSDSDASTLLDLLKTREGQKSLKAFKKALEKPTKSIFFDMIVVACEFLNASLFKLIHNSLNCRYEARKIVKCFASQDGLYILEHMLNWELSTLYDEFLARFLQRNELARHFFQTWADHNQTSCSQIDDIFKALWCSTGLYFVLASQHLDHVPKAWEHFECKKSAESPNCSGDQHCLGNLVYSLPPLLHRILSRCGSFIHDIGDRLQRKWDSLTWSKP